jgi:hypothetical protein
MCWISATEGRASCDLRGTLGLWLRGGGVRHVSTSSSLSTSRSTSLPIRRRSVESSSMPSPSHRPQGNLLAQSRVRHTQRGSSPVLSRVLITWQNLNLKLYWTTSYETANLEFKKIRSKLHFMSLITLHAKMISQTISDIQGCRYTSKYKFSFNNIIHILVGSLLLWNGQFKDTTVI